MKTKLLPLLFVSLFIFTCNDVTELNSEPADQQIAECCFETASLELITTEEIESLTFMIEEEKLARDVYLTLYSKYGQRSFNNIASSEQKHMDAVKNLMVLYEQELPATLESVGTFENDMLQDLYDDLVESGSVSLIDALKVGALVEEVDIRDLDELLKEVVQESAIQYVYTQLRSGSENHLRAYVRNLNRQGVTYNPELLTEEEYSAIVN